MSIISPTPQISKVPAFQWAHSGPLRTGSSSLDAVFGAKFRSTFHITDMYLELLNCSCG